MNNAAQQTRAEYNSKGINLAYRNMILGFQIIYNNQGFEAFTRWMNSNPLKTYTATAREQDWDLSRAKKRDVENLDALARMLKHAAEQENDELNRGLIATNFRDALNILDAGEEQ